MQRWSQERRDHDVSGFTETDFIKKNYICQRLSMRLSEQELIQGNPCLSGSVLELGCARWRQPQVTVRCPDTQLSVSFY